MSEVYIRSQNKEKFYMFGNGFNCLGYEKRNGRHVICIGGGVKTTEIIEVMCIADDSAEEIAEYESKERCIEVLDEIQAICRSYLKVEGGAALMRGGMDVQPAAFTVPRFYQMPEK